MQDQRDNSQATDLFTQIDLSSVTEMVGQIQQVRGAVNNPENVGGLIEIFILFYFLNSLLNSLTKLARAIHGNDKHAD